MVDELRAFRPPQRTPKGRSFQVDEVILVWDRGIDDSERVIRRLGLDDPWIRPIWFSRNFGQHAATLAGMTSTGGDWIVPMDEDGQHDPSYIGQMLDVAFDDRSQLAYASPSTRPPHGAIRNSASRTAKWVFSNILTNGNFGDFHSYFDLKKSGVGARVLVRDDG